MQKKLWVFLLGLFLVSVISGCWADEGKPTRSRVEQLPASGKGLEDGKIESSKVREDATSIENVKKGEGAYSPIFYDLRWSKNNLESVCKDLLKVINGDLKSSPYVDYANTKHFLPWDVVSGDRNAEIKYAKNKPWLVMYRPPVAKTIVDIDNDQEQEFVYIMTSYNPYAKQYLYIFRKRPSADLKIDENKNDHASDFSDFVNKERAINNLVGDGVYFKLPIWLKELPEFSSENQIAFRGYNSAFYIYKHGEQNYLIADSLNYNPDLERSITNNPWYMLFSVSDDGSLNKTCILKRTR